MDGEFGDMRPRDDGRPKYQSRRPTEAELRRMRSANNPHDQPTGDHTGRCMACGSRNLWTDNLTYGCSDCGEIYVRG
jgi:DNA-directed RNA polymerase subunit RPC12/RpoP